LAVKHTKTTNNHTTTMDDENIRRFDRANRVLTFCRDRAADIAPTSKIATLVAALSPLVEQLAAARIGQLRAPVGKPALIEALSIDFKDIARTARAIHLDDPSFPVAAYRHPGTYVETPVTTHADALLLLLEDQASDTAEQKTSKSALRARFVAYELPSDFVEDLRTDSDALAARNDSKYSDNQEGVASTAAIETLLAQAREIIQRLDAAFMNKYRNDPATITAWKSASRVERAPKRQKESAPPPANPA
jgi:hypothetical protein